MKVNLYEPQRPREKNEAPNWTRNWHRHVDHDIHSRNARQTDSLNLLDR
jgi:hypothetical protein